MFRTIWVYGNACLYIDHSAFQKAFFSFMSPELAKEEAAPMSFCAVTTRVRAPTCYWQHNNCGFVPTLPFLSIKAELQIRVLAKRTCYTLAPEWAAHIMQWDSLAKFPPLLTKHQCRDGQPMLLKSDCMQGYVLWIFQKSHLEWLAWTWSGLPKHLLI